MKKYIFPVILLVIVIALISYFYFNKFNFNNEINYSTNRMSVDVQNSTTLDNTVPSKPVITEEEISSFSTKIIDKDDNRDTNMKLTCNEINDTIVKNGEEFSFNKIAGNPTPDRGYKEAGIIVKGKLEKGYGGGNCQVSTTIYNAVNKIKDIEVTERHEHGVELGYIKKGKDSTVVYDDLDLKFKNNTGYDIKIYASTTDSEVTVKIIKINKS